MDKSIDLKVSFAGAEDGKLWGDVTVVETDVHEDGDVSNRITILNGAELTYVSKSLTTLRSKGRRGVLYVQEAGYDGETVHELLTGNGKTLRTYHYEQSASYAQKVHRRVVAQYLEEEHKEVLERLREKHKVVVERISALFK